MPNLGQWEVFAIVNGHPVRPGVGHNRGGPSADEPFHEYLKEVRTDGNALYPLLSLLGPFPMCPHHRINQAPFPLPKFQGFVCLLCLLQLHPPVVSSGPTNQFRSRLFRQIYLQPPFLKSARLACGIVGPFFATAVLSAEVRHS